MDNKDIDDILGGPEAWKNAELTDGKHRVRLCAPGPVRSASAPFVAAICTKCNNNKAYFLQLQVRSTEEPPTNFYKCAGCGYRWREESEDDTGGREVR